MKLLADVAGNGSWLSLWDLLGPLVSGKTNDDESKADLHALLR
jgi:hypothetical protein